MKRLLAFFLLSLSSFALTRISDTVYTATGEKAKPGSYLVVKWPRFTSNGLHAVVPNVQTVPLINGSFTVALEPTATATFPFQYTVEYHVVSDAGALSTYTETWNVADTTAQQAIADVVVTSTPVNSAAPPAMKGDLSTSDGVTAVRLAAPPSAGLVLQTDPAQPTGLKYAPLWGVFDLSGAAVAAQAAAQANAASAIAALGLKSASQHDATDFDASGSADAAERNAIAAAQANTAAAITTLNLNTASPHLATDFDIAGAAAAAQAAAQVYTDAAVAQISRMPGPAGAPGANGTSATVSVGTVSALAAGATPVITNSGTPSAAVFNFSIPTGATGPMGATGAPGSNGANGTAATINVGTVSALAAGATPTITNSGTSSAAVFNFGIPAGAAGSSGAAATLGVGTVTALAPGATPTVTNTGTANAAVLRFGIPAGAQGATGPAGTTGQTGANGTTGPAGAPGSNGANGTAATVSVGTVSSLAPGTTPTVINAGTNSAAVFNFGIPAGAPGPAGPTGPTGTTGATGPVGAAAQTLYGTYSAIPSTCTTGTTYTITSGLFDQAICTATNTWTYYYGHRPVTPAAKLSLTTAGAASTVTTTSTNGYELLTAQPGGSGNLTMRYFTAPSAAPYSVAFAIKPPAFIDYANYRELFLGWFDPAVGYQGLNCGTGNGSFSTTASCRFSTFGTNGGFTATQIATTQISGGFAAVQYIRLTNDGTNLSISLCSDYDNCQQIGSVTASTFFTGGLPTRLAWGLQNSTSYGSTSFTVIGIL